MNNRTIKRTDYLINEMLEIANKEEFIEIVIKIIKVFHMEIYEKENMVYQNENCIKQLTNIQSQLSGISF